LIFTKNDINKEDEERRLKEYLNLEEYFPIKLDIKKDRNSK